MNTKEVIILARKHITNEQSSARLCLSDAISLYNKGNYISAKSRAIKSLAYSVGIHHVDYKKANK